MNTQPNRLNQSAMKAGDLGWVCRTMVFSWRGDQSGDAAELFADIFGCAAMNTQRNKFPTASMPCRSWARGVSDGMAVDLHIGVDNDQSQMRLFAMSEDEPMPVVLARFRSRVEQLEAVATGSIADRRAVLDFDLPDKADRAGFLYWLGQEDWQAKARLVKQEYVFAPRGGSSELSVVASMDRFADSARLNVAVAVLANPSEAGSAELFDSFDRLLGTRRIADLASL